MSDTGAPASVRSLEQRIRNLEGSDRLALRRRVAIALVVVGQMLPEAAIKGGSAMALRYGRGTRFTQDLDAARVQPLARFRSDFEDSLSTGWAGFTGRLVEKTAPLPPAVPTAYVMQPFNVKLDYRGRPWCTVKFELGHNEVGDADEPEYHLAADLADLFTDVELDSPKPVPVMRAAHPVAQKLHAVSGEGSERARDLVDLQLLAWAKTSTPAASGRRAPDSSSIATSKPGLRPSWPATGGTPSTQLPSMTSTPCPTSQLPSPGSTRSSNALMPERAERGRDRPLPSSPFRLSWAPQLINRKCVEVELVYNLCTTPAFPGVSSVRQECWG